MAEKSTTTTTTTTTTAAVATADAAPVTVVTQDEPDTLEPVLTIIRKRVIADWSREQQIMIAGSMYPEINAFVLALDWQNLIHYEAPQNTPDVGIIFSKLHHEFARRFPAVRPVQSAAVRRLAHNISFLVWASLNAALEILKFYNRKRFQFEILKPILLATINSSNAAIGNVTKLEEPEAHAPLSLESKRKAAASNKVTLKVAKRVKKSTGANTSMVVADDVGSSTNANSAEIDAVNGANETIKSPFEIPSQ